MKDESKSADKSTKEAILDTALELFALQGYDATSTRQIAQKSNANLSAISYHFGSKEGLYRASFYHCFGFVEAILESAPTAPLERIAHYATKMSELHQKKPYIGRLFIENVINSKPFMFDDIAKRQAKMRGFFFEALQEGIKQGVFRADIDIASSAIALFGIVNFYFFVQTTKVLPQGFKNLSNVYAKNSLEIFLNGIKEKL
ncbi:TetR/AcrR family transcriptional regulator [Helicobacter macacae]|uniref:HTH tetR-type domain-containing protein n=1 Tax=Helicobacter macacae MIT 99-5501 TaxID=1357400 RepID=V8C947_9HELI|nr:TetR/AcrR family transcriptional regulator [Helicobacter macacae]ETD23520.1 hypothetical protein HMPREF2086_01325 [Helicobacter macacae MIT 99-5501]